MKNDKKRMHKANPDTKRKTPQYLDKSEVIFPQAPIIPGQEGYFNDADAIPFEEDYPPDKPPR